jgi:hypothetical protein
MISMRHKCIFVRISKTASSSVQNAFKCRQGPLDRGEFDIKHYTLGHYRDTHPLEFQTFYKFAFVRNPWDRIYSQYRFQHHIMVEKVPQMFEFAKCSFREWLLKCAESYNRPDQFLFGTHREIFEHHLTNQLDWVTLDGKIATDFLGRFENLDQDFAKVCSDLGVQLDLPRDNTSPPSNGYRDAYDEETRDLVRQWHARDIEHFGYRF